MRILHVAPVADERWVVTLDEDATSPVSEHASRDEAEAAARAYAQSFGYPEVVVHGADGEETRMLLDVDASPPYSGGARGASAA